jgi:methyl-accepting chemotaxis protein
MTYNVELYSVIMSIGSGRSIKGRRKHQKIYSSQATPEQIAQSLKSLARSIHEGSSRMTRTVQVLHQSGAISDISLAVREASVAARDTAREIRDTARDLKEGSVVGDTARAIQETTASAYSTVDTVVAIASETIKPYPKAIMTRVPEWTSS